MKNALKIEIEKGKENNCLRGWHENILLFFTGDKKITHKERKRLKFKKIIENEHCTCLHGLM